MTTNNIDDRKEGRVVGHTAGGMGGFSHRHWLQLFNLDRAMYRLIKYVSTSYRSLSARGIEETQKSIDRTRQQSQLTELMTGSDHSKQRIIFEELDLRTDRLEAAVELKFERPINSGKVSAPKQRSREIMTVMSLVMAREFLDEAAYAMSFPYESEEAQIVWAGLGHRHSKGQPNALKGLANFRHKKMTLAHRYRGVAPWFNPLPGRWARGAERPLEKNPNDHLHLLVHDLYQLHRARYVEQRCKQEFRKLQSIRNSIHPLAKRYVNVTTQRYGVSFLSSKEDPNRAPANNAWRMGAMIFQPRDSRTQKKITNIATPGLVVISDHYTNERYAQITENATSGTQSGSFGTTRSKDAGPYPYRSEQGPVDRGLRRFPGEGGGRSGLQGMAYARYMYQTAEMITVAQNVNEVTEESPFRTYSAPMVSIAQTINILITRMEEGRPNKEVWDDVITAGALLEALRNCASMYVYRTGTWTEYNTVFGNRLTEGGRPNHCIPTTPKLISRMDRCMKEYTRLLYCLDGLILGYLWSLGNDQSRVLLAPDSIEPKAKYNAWAVRYRWHGVSDRYRLFKPKYSGDNSGRRRQLALREKRRVSHVQQLGRSRLWEGSPEQCRLRILDNQTPASDPYEDLEGLFRKTIRIIVEDRFRMFAKVMQMQMQEGKNEDAEVPQELCKIDRSGAYAEIRKRQHESGKDKVVETPRGRTVEKSIKRSKWMVTWTRLETALPFPELETYIPMKAEWSEQIAKDLEETPRNRKCGHNLRGQRLRIPNRVNWSAVTVRKKIHLQGNEPVVTERVTIYVEFDFPIAKEDLQLLVEKWFACMKTTDEWRLKMRLWDGSDPIEQIHTRDPTSKAELTKHLQIMGEYRHVDPRQSDSRIGTSGRRPLASDLSVIGR